MSLHGLHRFAALLILPLMLAGEPVFAAEPQSKGVLDVSPVMPTTGSGATQTVQADKPAKDQMQSALKEEREELKKNSRQELVAKANNGERAAQLVLAEEFADEANYESITIVSANDALSDAAYWYSLAARRGYPGAPAVDGALPIFPLRPLRTAD